MSKLSFIKVKVLQRQNPCCCKTHTIIEIVTFKICTIVLPCKVTSMMAKRSTSACLKDCGRRGNDYRTFENCILKTFCLTPWPTYETYQNHLNNFGREPPRDHTCKVWSKSNEWFQRRICLSKKFTHDARRTTDDDGRRTKTGHNSSSWALCA